MNLDVKEKQYYPISINEIESIVLRKRVRRNDYQLKLLRYNQADNVKKITNEYGEKITRVDGDIPIDLPVKNGNRFLFISYDQTKLTHGLHKYPAKFFPELPRWLIARYPNGQDLYLTI